MITNIFVNMPVKDLEKSKAFFIALGFSFNPQFTDDTAGALVVGPNIYAMLLTHPKWASLLKRDIADTSKALEVSNALSVETKAEVDEMMAKVLAAGGTASDVGEDAGYMYSRSFYDLDGHHWELFWMDQSFVQKA